MTEREVTIIDPKGIHARPAAQLVAAAGRFESAITLAQGDQLVSARSILGIMILALRPGTTLKVIADGPDEHAAADAVAQLLCQAHIV